MFNNVANGDLVVLDDPEEEMELVSDGEEEMDLFGGEDEDGESVMEEVSQPRLLSLQESSSFFLHTRYHTLLLNLSCSRTRRSQAPRMGMITRLVTMKVAMKTMTPILKIFSMRKTRTSPQSPSQRGTHLQDPIGPTSI